MPHSLLFSWRRLLVPLGLALLLAAAPVAARELAVAPDAMVEVEVATVGMAGMGSVPVVLLREPGAREVIPIFIGPVEARAILRALAGDRPRRPLTHELLDGIAVRLERIYIDALVEGTFLGMLELRREGDDAPLRIDSRPSDAIALAVTAGASIHVAPEVLEAARQIDYEGIEDQVVVALG